MPTHSSVLFASDLSQQHHSQDDHANDQEDAHHGSMAIMGEGGGPRRRFNIAHLLLRPLGSGSAAGTTGGGSGRETVHVIDLHQHGLPGPVSVMLPPRESRDARCTDHGVQLLLCRQEQVQSFASSTVLPYRTRTPPGPAAHQQVSGWDELVCRHPPQSGPARW